MSHVGTDSGCYLRPSREKHNNNNNKTFTSAVDGVGPTSRGGWYVGGGVDGTVGGTSVCMVSGTVDGAVPLTARSQKRKEGYVGGGRMTGGWVDAEME